MTGTVWLDGNVNSDDNDVALTVTKWERRTTMWFGVEESREEKTKWDRIFLSVMGFIQILNVMAK